MPDPACVARVERAIMRHEERPDALLQILVEVQAGENWLSPEVISLIAKRLGVPRARVEGVAGFYSFLHTEPVGQYRILFSDNIIDQMLGSQALMAQMCRELIVEPGHLSEDGLVSVDTTSCTGMGDQGPAILVNGRAIPRLTPPRVHEVCELVRDRRPLDSWPPGLFHVDDNIRRKDDLLGCDMAPGDALRAAVALGRDGWLEEVKRARLRGHGGAGFPTALKWQTCRDAPGIDKVVVCNADEGEPGTFKDRVLLNSYPDLVIEGMTLAAWALGAAQGFIYLRGEYLHLRDPLQAVLDRRRHAGLLGQNILGTPDFDFDIQIHLGAGAYVCGEETALIESLEGKRGTPRIRPPYPVVSGYLGRPTAVNNVETLAKCCLIARQGGEAFAQKGTAQSTGTKLLSISGDCARPGVYEYAFGTPIAQILEDCGASDVMALQIGGAAGVTIAPYEFVRSIAFEDVPTAGAFMVFNSSRDMFEVARNFVHFFAHESCGFCTPCRVGTTLLSKALDKLAAGYGSSADLREIDDLDRVLKQASHCGLGGAAANPVLDGLAKFRPVYERHMRRKDFAPAFDLDGALARARQMTGRDDAGAHLSNREDA